MIYKNYIQGNNNNFENIFYKSTYKNEQNGQEYPMYVMNRDSFTMLVMGFTGQKALDWKMKYINSFNRMEEQLKNMAKFNNIMS